MGSVWCGLARYGQAGWGVARFGMLWFSFYRKKHLTKIHPVLKYNRWAGGALAPKKVILVVALKN